MSFDRLSPTKHGEAYSCVHRTQDGYQVLAVPPCLTVINDGEDYRCSTGWYEALDGCLDMPVPRREYLKTTMRVLLEDPDAHVQNVDGISVRQPLWL
jgi:hypothetical protein